MTSPQQHIYVLPPQRGEYPTYQLYLAAYQAWTSNPDPTAGMTPAEQIALQTQRLQASRSTKVGKVVVWCVAAVIFLAIVMLFLSLRYV